MSQIVSAAKTTVALMATGGEGIITPADKRAMTAWCAVTAIVAEYTDPKTIAIPKLDVEYVYEKRIPPTSWSICIGRYEGKEWSPDRYRHYGMFLHPSEAERAGKAVETLKREYLHVSTYALGKLALQIFACTLPNVVDIFRMNFIPHTMISIFPDSEEAVTWPSTPVLGDSDMNEIDQTFIMDFVASTASN